VNLDFCYMRSVDITIKNRVLLDSVYIELSGGESRPCKVGGAPPGGEGPRGGVCGGGMGGGG
jgi:hypothetical protein